MKKKKYVVEDLQLDDDLEYEKIAFDNSIKLYNSFKDLPRYVLCNNRFWAWVTFEKAYRQAIHSTKLTKDFLKNKWLAGNSRRELLLGVMSRYYFYVEITIDERLNDIYEVTKYALKHSEGCRSLAYRNIGMLKSVSLEYFRVQKDFTENTGIRISRRCSRELIKEASRMGSVMLIDLAPNEEIYNYLYLKLIKIVKNKEIIHI